MAAWTRTLFALTTLLLLGLLAPSRAEEARGGHDEEDEKEVELAGDPPEDEPHNEEDWEQLKKNIMDSLPDDEEEKEAEDEHEHERWHMTQGYPFIEYNGFIPDDESRTMKGESSTMNLHTAKMTLTEAKEWCAAKEECMAFNHAGHPEEGPFEMIFKDYWKLSNVESEEAEDAWTSYMKGPKVIDEEEGPNDDGENPDISSEEVMKEHGMDVDQGQEL